MTTNEVGEAMRLAKSVFPKVRSERIGKTWNWQIVVEHTDCEKVFATLRDVELEVSFFRSLTDWKDD